MNLSDLRVFTIVARHTSLHAAARELHLTPSAVSKALRRLEDDLGVVLFDRGTRQPRRQLLLNENGTHLLAQARTLLDLARQARADLQGERAAIACRIGGPAVLLWREGAALADALADHAAAQLRMDAMFEGDALAALARGELDAALVTEEALGSRHWSTDWEVGDLGQITLGLVAGRTHPLAVSGAPVGLDELLAFPFAAPARSLFCGQARGSRSDGWRDDLHPRTIRYWCDDLQVLLGLVGAGKALAYLPGFAARDAALVDIPVLEAGCVSTEQVRLVWNGLTAPRWLRQLAAALAARQA